MSDETPVERRLRESLAAAPPRAAIEQAARLIRLWSADRMRATGKWTAQEQAGIECAIQLEAALAPPTEPTR